MFPRGSQEKIQPFNFVYNMEVITMESIVHKKDLGLRFDSHLTFNSYLCNIKRPNIVTVCKTTLF